MINLDSVKLSVNVEALKGLKVEKFKRNSSISEDRETTWLSSDPKKTPIGIGRIQITDSQVIIETSAKILKENYLLGLNVNTVNQYLDEINKSELIEIDPALFMKYAEPHKIDITENLRPQINSVSKVITDLSIFSTEKGYRTLPHKTGIEVNAKAKSNNTRLIGYDKGADLIRDIKENRELFNTFSLKNYCKTLSDAQGIFRVEQNLRHLKDIRDTFHLPIGTPLYFEDILNSKVNVLSETVCKLYDINSINFDNTLERKGDILMELVNSKRSYAQVRKEYFMRDLIVLCKYDIDLIMRIVRQKVKGDLSAYRKEYRALIKVMQSEQLQNNFSSLIEVKELLRVA